MAPPVANIPELLPAPAPPALLAPPPTAGVTFALTPAKHNNGILDYGSVKGRKLYTTATAALPIKIDVSPHQTLMLLTEMSCKSYNNGWGNLWKISCKFNANGAVTTDLSLEN
jgi:hypothetical protein